MTHVEADIRHAEGLLQDLTATQVPEPPACLVSLPGGFVDPEGAVIRDVLVRELTGQDEEQIARVANKQGQIDLVRMLETIYELGTVKIGTLDANRSLLNSLLVGDKDAILLGIRIATFGPDYETRIGCPKCGEESDVVFELLADVPERKLEDPENIYRTVKLRNGSAEVRLPTVGDQSYATDDPKRTVPEANTRLLGRCVKTINGKLTRGEQSVRDLGLQDVRTLLKHINDTVPGPRMGEVKVECPACKEESQFTLSMPALFL